MCLVMGRLSLESPLAIRHFLRVIGLKYWAFSAEAMALSSISLNIVIVIAFLSLSFYSCLQRLLLKPPLGGPGLLPGFQIQYTVELRCDFIEDS